MKRPVYVLRNSEVKARAFHECAHCGRPIAPGERCWAKAILYVEPESRYVISHYSCCGPLK